MEANAQDPAGAASLGKAIGSHDAGLVEGGVDLDQVDADDGDKIVSNVFGGQRDQVVNQLGSQGGGDSGLIGKLLPLLAPIVMSYLAKQMSSRSTQGGGRRRWRADRHPGQRARRRRRRQGRRRPRHRLRAGRPAGRREALAQRIPR